MFKWLFGRTAVEPPPPAEGWRYKGSLTDNMDLSGILGALGGWGFEVSRSSGPDGLWAQDILHSAADMGLRTTGWDLDDTLASIYWGIKAGRASMAADLAAAQRGRQVAIDLLTEYINSESTRVEEARAATMRQVIAHGQVQPQEAHMVGRLNMIDDVLCKLREILEKVVRS